MLSLMTHHLNKKMVCPSHREADDGTYHIVKQKEKSAMS